MTQASFNERKGMYEPIEFELSAHANNLYIFFGGIAAGIAMPPFEFYNAAKIMDEHKIFIRDFSQSWYQTGLPGVGANVYSIAQYIQNQIDDLNPHKVFFIGNSMGGYAAILFSELVGSGDAIVFSPQTFISPYLRMKHRDMRWSKQISNMYKKSLFKRKVWNLRLLLLHSKVDRNITVFVSKADKLDLIHANHIRDIHGVDIHEFHNGGHSVVKLLRDEGKLAEIISGRFSTSTN